MKYLVLLTVLLALSACAHHGDLAPTSNAPICDALIGPIRYNPTKKASRRYAGPDLVPDLKARNQVGENLSCPAYGE